MAVAAINQGKWTGMDSEIRAAEADLFTGGERYNYKETSLSGYNTGYDSQVTHLYQPGDPAIDDEYLNDVFENYFTTNEKKGGVKVLRKSLARGASKEVVQAWNHVSEEKARSYLDKHFEKVWRQYDVNNEGEIYLSEAHNFEKSLLGSFYVTYSDE